MGRRHGPENDIQLLPIPEGTEEQALFQQQNRIVQQGNKEAGQGPCAVLHPGCRGKVPDLPVQPLQLQGRRKANKGEGIC